MLLPMLLETAMSPCPRLATARDESMSGTLVPAARNVRPMMVSSIPSVYPIVVASDTITYAAASHRKAA